MLYYQLIFYLIITNCLFYLNNPNFNKIIYVLISGFLVLFYSFIILFLDKKQYFISNLTKLYVETKKNQFEFLDDFANGIYFFDYSDIKELINDVDFLKKIKKSNFSKRGIYIQSKKNNLYITTGITLFCNNYSLKKLDLTGINIFYNKFNKKIYILYLSLLFKYLSIFMLFLLMIVWFFFLKNQIILIIIILMNFFSFIDYFFLKYLNMKKSRCYANELLFLIEKMYNENKLSKLKLKKIPGSFFK